MQIVYKEMTRDGAMSNLAKLARTLKILEDPGKKMKDP